jgi:hypothetical protein
LEESERRVAIRRLDWDRLKRDISLCKGAKSLDYSGTYYTLFGVAGSCLTALIPLYFAQGLPSWVTPTYAVATIASLILACALMSVNKSVKSASSERVAEIEKDMKEIEDGFPKP